MVVEIRELEGEAEARELRRIGRRSFHPAFTLIIPMPKWAYGAFENGKCLGGVLLKKVGTIGVVDFIFIAREGRGRGLAKQLTQKAMEVFQLEGVTTVAASVRDDNTASWNLFAARGFKACSIGGLIRELGLRQALSLSFATSQAMAFGFDLWVGSLEDALDPKADQRVTESDTVAGNSISTLAWHVVLNLLPLSAAVWRYNSRYVYWVVALGAIIVTRLLFSYIGAVLFYRPARMRMARGGYILAIPGHAAGNVFFYPAYWHPKIPRWREPEYRTGLGVSALLGVLATMGLFGASSFLISAGVLQSPFAAGIAATIVEAGRFVLIMEIQPLFEAWSGPRIRRWNLVVYLLVLAAGIFLVGWA